jgi:hypothetical protein
VKVSAEDETGSVFKSYGINVSMAESAFTKALEWLLLAQQNADIITCVQTDQKRT